MNKTFRNYVSEFKKKISEPAVSHADFWRSDEFRQLARESAARQAAERSQPAPSVAPAQRPTNANWTIGDRVYRAADGGYTNTETDTPVFWDATKNVFTDEQTDLPAVYGMQVQYGAFEMKHTPEVVYPTELSSAYQSRPPSETRSEFKPEDLINIRNRGMALGDDLEDLERQRNRLGAGGRSISGSDGAAYVQKLNEDIERIKQQLGVVSQQEEVLSQSPAVQQAAQISDLLSTENEARAIAVANARDEDIIRRSEVDMEAIKSEFPDIEEDPWVADPEGNQQFKLLELGRTIDEARKRIQERSQEGPTVVTIIGPDGQPTPVLLEQATDRGFTGWIGNLVTRPSKAGENWFGRELEKSHPVVPTVWYMVNTWWNAAKLTVESAYHNLTELPAAWRIAADWAKDPEAPVYTAMLGQHGPTMLRDQRRVMDAINVARQQRDGQKATFWEILSAFKVGLSDLVYSNIQDQFDETAHWMGQTLDVAERTFEDAQTGERQTDIEALRQFMKDKANNTELAEVVATSVASGKTLLDETNNNILNLPDDTIRSNMEISYAYFEQAWKAQLERTDIQTGFFRHTWVMADDGEARKEMASQAVVQAMAQLGRMLEPWEIEQITSRFTDPGAQFGGEMIFDPLNLIPGVIFEKAILKPGKWLLKLPFAGTAKVFETIAPVAYQTASAWIQAKSVYSAAWNLVGHKWGRAAIVMARSVETVEDFKGLLKTMLDVAQDIPTGQLPLTRVRLIEAANALKIKPDDLVKILENVRQMAFSNEAGRLERMLVNGSKVMISGELVELTDDLVQQLALRYANSPGNLVGPMADEMVSHFIDGHRLWKGGPVDESIITWFLRKKGLSDKGGQQFLTLPGGQKLRKETITGLLNAGNMLRSVWIGSVLTMRPGFTVINYLDTMFRAVLFGARFGDDVPTMLKALGDYLPLEIRTRFSKFEFEGTDLIEALTSDYFSNTLGRQPNLRDIFKLGWNNAPGKDAITKWTNGWYAINSYFEFLWSTRLFYRRFTDDMLTAQSLIMRNLDELLPLEDDLARSIADDLIGRNVNNPAGLDEQIRQATRFQIGKGRPAWSRLYPRQLVTALGESIGPANARRFFNNITDEMLQIIRKEGALTDSVVDDLFDSVIKEIADQSDAVIRSTEEAKMLDGGLNLDPVMHNIDDITEEVMLNEPKVIPPEPFVVDDVFKADLDVLVKSKTPISEISDPIFKAEATQELNGMIADLENARPARDLFGPQGEYLGRRPSNYPSWYSKFVAGENSRGMPWKKGRQALLDKLQAIEKGEGAGAWDRPLRDAIQENIRKGVDDGVSGTRYYPYYAQKTGQSPEIVGELLKSLEQTSLDDYARKIVGEVETTDDAIQLLGEGNTLERQLEAGVADEIIESHRPSSIAKKLAAERAARGHRRMAEAADQLNFRLDEITIEDPLYEPISKSARYVGTAVSNHQELMSGGMQRWMVEQYPGPLAAWGHFRADRWTDYNMMRAAMFDSISEDIRKITELVDAENWEELAKLWDGREFTSRADLLQDAGWRFQWEGDELIALSNEYIKGGLWWIEDNDRLSRFAYALDIHTKEEFEGAFLRRATRDAMQKEAEAIVPEVIVTSLGAEGLAIPTISSASETYPIANDIVSGLTVRESVPNLDSIPASLNQYEVLPGIREVKMEDFPGITGKTYSVEGNERIRSLADDISSSNEITPLIVVVDKDGPYILEGSTRIDALKQLDIESFPAVVVLDTEDVGRVASEELPAFDEELQTIWDTLYRKEYPGGKLNRFNRSTLPDGTPANESAETMMAFLRGRADDLEKKGETAAAKALREQADLLEEDWNALRFAAGQEGILKPHKPSPTRWTRGAETHLRSSHSAATTRLLLEETIEDWRTYLKDSIRSGSYITQKLPKQTRKALAEWGSQAVDLQAKALEIATTGGEFLGHQFEGAVPLVNRVMLDYQNYTRVEKNIKQWANPFWMFPSRSLPFWADTLISHPQIVAFYMKYLEASRRFAYEIGGVTSRGEQLPSLAGYMPIPGTDIWINPVAPFSFRYIFPKEYDRYDDDQGELTPGQQAVAWLYENMTMFGLSMAPWVSGALYKTGLLDEKSFPSRSLIPQVDLIPPGAQRILTSFLRRYAFPNMPDLWTPQVSWKDYMVERNMLEAALQEISRPGLTQEEKFAIVNRYEKALDKRNRVDGNGEYIDAEAAGMWGQFEANYENVDWASRTIGYFTGVYGKQYTDADAALLKLRDEINALKRGLNDEMLATIFDLYPEADQRWGFYTDRRYRTPEGWIQSLYSMIGWTTTTDEDTGIETKLYGQPRREYISQQILEEQATRSRFDAITAAKEELRNTLLSLPIGEDNDLVRQAYTNYYDKIGTIEGATQYDAARREWVVGYKPKKLVWEDIRNLFWNTVLKTWPSRQPDEEWSAYQSRIQVWMNVQFPLMAEQSEVFWSKLYSINWVQPEVNMPKDIVAQLKEEASYDGYLNWKKETATPEEAVSMWWTENVWNPYWLAIDGTSGHEHDLAASEFASQWEGGKPSEQDVINGVVEMFGGRFTGADIADVVLGREVYSPQDRLGSGRAAEVGPEAAELEQRMWDAKKRIPPSQTFDFLKEFKRIGGDETFYWAFIRTGKVFGDVDEFKQQVGLAEKAIMSLGYSPPDEATLREWSTAEGENDQFWGLVKGQYGESVRDIWNYYWALSSSEQRAFRKDQAETYKIVETIFDMKDSFAADHPLWQKYYHETYDPTKGTSGGSGGGGGGSSSGGSGVSVTSQYIPLGYRSTLDPARLIIPGVLGKGGAGGALKWPKGFRSAVGEQVIQEANDAVTGVKPLSSAAEEFLTKVSSRHEEWQGMISAVIKASNLNKHKVSYGSLNPALYKEYSS